MADLRYRDAYFMAGKLAALSGLRALRDLDLKFVGISQIITGHAEPSGCDLLYRRTQTIAIGKGNKPYRVLPALARVWFSAQAIHRGGHRLVRLFTYRPETHGSGNKTLDYPRCRLDLFQRYGADALSASGRKF